MSSIDVAIVEIHSAFGNVSYMIKRVAPGRDFMGWAKFDGTFTKGLNPQAEIMEWGLVQAPNYVEDAIGFAQAQGWNVVRVLRR